MKQTAKSIDVIIIGAGLTGLTLGYLLNKTNISFAIIEASNKIGGRIQTNYQGERNPVEMGATWLGSKHKHLINLLEETGVEAFDQIIGDSAIYEAISTSPHYLAKLPPNPDPSLRIRGGTMEIIKVLSNSIDFSNILLDSPVTEISKKEASVFTSTKSQKFESKFVVSTLPPNLLSNTITINPSLPYDLSRIAKSTHTWMGESIKIALTFKEAFWRKSHLSGTVISNVGPISEMYDHSNYEDNFYALKGFLNGSYFDLTKTERLKTILDQLRKYYGPEIDKYVTYHEKVWRKDQNTYYPYEEHVLPHQNNGHQIYAQSYLDNSIFIAGSETSPLHPGYMDGAVYSAKSTFDKLTSLL